MIDISKVKNEIERGSTALGIEFGSTRIKAVLIGSDYQLLVFGSFGWENAYVDGVWTYAMTDVAAGLQSCYRALCAEEIRARPLSIMVGGTCCTPRALRTRESTTTILT